MTIEDVATFEDLHWQTVKEIDKKAIEKALEKKKFRWDKHFRDNEKASGKGHKYLHMIVALKRPNGCEVLYVGDGRKEKDLEPFWDWFKIYSSRKDYPCSHGLWKGFIKSFRKHCPEVKIIYDKFHIIRHLLQCSK